MQDMTIDYLNVHFILKRFLCGEKVQLVKKKYFILLSQTRYLASVVVQAILF